MSPVPHTPSQESGRDWYIRSVRTFVWMVFGLSPSQRRLVMERVDKVGAILSTSAILAALLLAARKFRLFDRLVAVFRDAPVKAWLGEFLESKGKGMWVKPRPPMALEGLRMGASDIDQPLSTDLDGSSVTLVDENGVAFGGGAILQGSVKAYLVTAGHNLPHIRGKNVRLVRGTRKFLLADDATVYAPTHMDIAIIALPSAACAVLKVRRVPLMDVRVQPGSALYIEMTGQNAVEVRYGILTGNLGPNLQGHTVATRPGYSGTGVYVRTGPARTDRLGGIHIGYNPADEVNCLVPSTLIVGTMAAIDSVAFAPPGLRAAARLLRQSSFVPESESSRSTGGEDYISMAQHVLELAISSRDGQSLRSVRQALFEIIEDENPLEVEGKIAEAVDKAERALQEGLADYTVGGIRSKVVRDVAGSFVIKGRAPSSRAFEEECGATKAAHPPPSPAGAAAPPVPTLDAQGSVEIRGRAPSSRATVQETAGSLVCLGNVPYRGTEAAAPQMPPAVSAALDVLPADMRAEYAMPARTREVTLSAVAWSLQHREVPFVMDDRVANSMFNYLNQALADGLPYTPEERSVREYLLNEGGHVSMNRLADFYLASGGRPDVMAYPHNMCMRDYLKSPQYKQDYDQLVGVFLSAKGLDLDEPFTPQYNAWSTFRGWKEILEAPLDKLMARVRARVPLHLQPQNYAIVKNEPNKREKIEQGRPRLVYSLGGIAKVLERWMYLGLLKGFLQFHKLPNHPCASGIGLDDNGLAHIRSLFDAQFIGTASVLSMDASNADYTCPFAVHAATGALALHWFTGRMAPGVPFVDWGLLDMFYFRSIQYLVLNSCNLQVVVTGGDVFDLSRCRSGLASGMLTTNLAHTAVVHAATLEMPLSTNIVGTGDDLALRTRQGPEEAITWMKRSSNYSMRITGKATVRFTGGTGKARLVEGVVDVCSTDVFTSAPLSGVKMIIRAFSKPYTPEREQQLRYSLRHWDETRKEGVPSLEDLITAARLAGWGKFEAPVKPSSFVPVAGDSDEESAE